MINPKFLIISFIAIIFILVGSYSNAQDCQSSEQFNRSAQFNQMLGSLETAIQEFVNGNPSAFKQMWLHSENVTLAGGFGGKVEKGWDQIGQRLDRVVASYEKAPTEFRYEQLNSYTSGNLGYLVQHETFITNQQESRRDYRVTMIFQQTKQGWQILHRHADSAINKDLVITN